MVWDDHMIGQRGAYSQVAAVTMGRATSQIWARAVNEYEPSPNHAGGWYPSLWIPSVDSQLVGVCEGAVMPRMIEG